MRLRWTLALAFVVLALVQVAIVVPQALRNLTQLLGEQHDVRVKQVMAAVESETKRLQADVKRTMDELAESSALEEAARDAARVPAPSSVTRAANQLMTPRGLDVLAVLDEDGRTLSSGHLPARLGEPDDPLFIATKAPPKSVTTVQVEVQGAAQLVSAVAAVSARAIDYGEHRVWVVGGVLLDDKRARALSAITGARVQVIADGKVAASAGEPKPPETHRSVALGKDTSLEISVSRADALATREEVQRAFIVLGLLGLLFSIIGGVFVSRRITRPVEALTEAARHIAQGVPGVKVDQRGATAELKVLVDTFNRMTDDLKVATDKLVSTERIAAWQEVARRLAHEIKNPLTPIRMSLETLLAASQRTELDERFKRLFVESAHAVLEEVDRLKRIVDEFSQFARLPKPVLAPLDLAEAVRQVLALYADHGGVSYVSELESSATIAGDRDQLTQVLVNLIKNAEEAMAPQGGGRITVRVAKRGTDVVLEVEDAGPGISAELKQRLFEPYVTTKAQGTGLGLAIALRILQEHQGRLEVLDAPSRGALMRATVPALAQ